MRVPWRLLAVCSSIASFCGDVSANSTPRGPLNRVSLVNKPLIHTPSHRVHADSHFDITFTADTRHVKLSLDPNHDLIPEGATIQRVGGDGKIEKLEPLKREHHLVFEGLSWFQKSDGSWVHAGHSRITVRRSGPKPLFSGSFTLGNEQYHIQLGSFYQSTKHELDVFLDHDPKESMIVFKDGDIQTHSNLELKRDLESGTSCHSHNLSFNTNPDHSLWQDPRGVSPWARMSMESLFGKRQIEGGNGFPGSGNGGVVNLRQTIGQTAGCPSTRKVALIGVATDCSYTATFDTDAELRENVLTQINSASGVYERTFNITLGIQNMTISPRDCPGTPPQSVPWNQGCSNSVTITDRLNLFSEWRSNQNDNNAYWTLLTDCNTGSEVGLAWLGQLCVNDLTQSGGESTSGANVVAKTNMEWQVIAHEAGHTFGAVHDCDSSTCENSNAVASSTCCPRSATTCDADSGFIMNPSTVEGVNLFSPCTIGNICSAFRRNSVRSDCLSDNRNVQTFQQGQCGNGIVEDGEECDCGGEDGCGNNSCCDPGTCRFRSGAVCDDSNEDCCNNCQYASQGTVCRSSTGQCDPEEVCSGNNATCPSDVTTPDGEDCGNGLQCASGQCTSRDLQCKTLMGSYTTNNDTYACSNSGCVLSCASPQFGRNECYSMSQYFLDGTPCGGGGSCSNGQCAGSSVGGEISSWIDQNRPLVIGVCSGVGGLIVLAILGCIISRCRRNRRVNKRKKIPSQIAGAPSPTYPGMAQSARSSQWPGQNHQSWNGSQQQQYWQGQSYQNQNPNQNWGNTGWNESGYGRHQSVRYA